MQKTQTILLTGGTGFLGSKLLDYFLINNYKVILLKRSFSDTKRIDNFLKSSLLKIYDIDKIQIENIFIDNNITCIIHTATNYGRGINSFSSMIESNLLFPLKILEFAIKYNVNTFYNFDTSLPDGLNYYVISKKQFLYYGKLLIKNINFNFINLKLEHIYGPGDDESKFVGMIIGKILNNEKFINLTLGEQERDFIYIDDVVNLFTILFKGNYIGFHEYHIGSGKVIKIKDLVIKIADLMNSNIVLNFGSINYRDGEQMYSCAKINKQFQDFDFTVLENGLINTIKYLKTNL